MEKIHENSVTIRRSVFATKVKESCGLVEMPYYTYELIVDEKILVKQEISGVDDCFLSDVYFELLRAKKLKAAKRKAKRGIVRLFRDKNDVTISIQNLIGRAVVTNHKDGEELTEQIKEALLQAINEIPNLNN